jgi:hypothetical protein
MKYYIQRQLNEYGPYTLADLQRYVAQGSILLTDLTRSEGLTEWVPVSQVIGNIPVPVPTVAQPPGDPAYGGGTVYSGGGGTVYGAGTVYGGGSVPAERAGPMPPDLHWALILLIGFFCGIFHLVWLFIEAGFVKKIDPESKGIALLIGAMVTQVVALIVFFAAAGVSSGRDEPPALALTLFLLLFVGGVVLQIMAVFNMRSSLEDYYNTVEPISLRLSGVMTFFFAIYYFQYHFSRIAAWKKTGYLQPQ